MQGKKVYQEQLFNSFRLSKRVPVTNFYRRLKEALNLDFLYELTRDRTKKTNKCMHLAAIAYNLKKYLKFTQNLVKSGAGMPGVYFRLKTALKEAFKSILSYVNLECFQWSQTRKPRNPEAWGGLN